MFKVYVRHLNEVLTLWKSYVIKRFCRTLRSKWDWWMQICLASCFFSLFSPHPSASLIAGCLSLPGRHFSACERSQQPAHWPDSCSTQRKKSGWLKRLYAEWKVSSFNQKLHLIWYMWVLTVNLMVFCAQQTENFPLRVWETEMKRSRDRTYMYLLLNSGFKQEVSV